MPGSPMVGQLVCVPIARSRLRCPRPLAGPAHELHPILWLKMPLSLPFWLDTRQLLGGAAAGSRASTEVEGLREPAKTDGVPSVTAGYRGPPGGGCPVRRATSLLSPQRLVPAPHTGHTEWLRRLAWPAEVLRALCGNASQVGCQLPTCDTLYLADLGP